jgi:hypothetical protein
MILFVNIGMPRRICLNTLEHASLLFRNSIKTVLSLQSKLRGAVESDPKRRSGQIHALFGAGSEIFGARTDA